MKAKHIIIFGSAAFSGVIGAFALKDTPNKSYEINAYEIVTEEQLEETTVTKKEEKVDQKETVTIEEKKEEQTLSTKNESNCKKEDNKKEEAKMDNYDNPTTEEITYEEGIVYPTPGDKPENPPVTEATTEEQGTWYPPVYEDVWVVDEAAYSEEIPLYEEHEAAECVKCHAILYSQAEVEAHGNLPACEPLQYRNYVYTVQSGITTIYHEEKGHYETRLVNPGHWK